MRVFLHCLVAGIALVAAAAVAQDKFDGKAGKPVALNQARPDAKGRNAMMEKPAPFDKSAPVDKSNPGKKASPKFVEEVRPFRDPQPVADAVDRWVDAALVKARLPASPQADDGEFLRRLTVDIIGRVPTTDEATAFLESTASDRRARWIDTLLGSPSYGDHFATIWHELMLPRDNGVKGGRNEFAPWLAEQFSRNRGWDRIVSDMLTVEGKIRDQPQAGFILANCEDFEPEANLLADSTGRLFWGVQLRCAECHNHPFASWKQGDFWGTAAFFSRLRRGSVEGKNPSGWTFTEAASEEAVTPPPTKPTRAPGVAGPAILIPSAAGKYAGKVVKAKFLGGPEPGWTDDGPFRERFAQWATSGRNPWFAANGVNRVWAHFFTRGLVMPMDGFNDENPPSHPELLAMLGKELVDSGFDLKHLIRCVCNSRAYQRTSRAAAGNERDEKWFSHRLVKVMRPEVLYDSLSAVLQPAGRKNAAQPVSVERTQLLEGVPRDEFIRFFGSRPDENEGSMVNQGIPQFLRLMNGSLLNAETLVARLTKASGGRDPIDVAYLAAYCRRPNEEERRLVQDYLAAAGDSREASAGLLWTLLNSAEFVTNH